MLASLRNVTVMYIDEHGEEITKHYEKWCPAHENFIETVSKEFFAGDISKYKDIRIMEAVKIGRVEVRHI